MVVTDKYYDKYNVPKMNFNLKLYFFNFNSLGFYFLLYLQKSLSNNLPIIKIFVKF